MPVKSRPLRRFLVVVFALAIAACSGDSESTSTTVDESILTTTTADSSTGGALAPDVSTTSTAPTTTTLPEDNPLVQAELVVEVDGATIIFDQRPFSLMDGSGLVQVLGPNNDILAEGPFEGDDSIMHQLPDGSFEFVDSDGNVVATMTQQELNDALTQAST